MDCGSSANFNKLHMYVKNDKNVNHLYLFTYMSLKKPKYLLQLISYISIIYLASLILESKKGRTQMCIICRMEYTSFDR